MVIGRFSSIEAKPTAPLYVTPLSKLAIYAKPGAFGENFLIIV